jgi:hypothetical protein
VNTTGIIHNPAMEPHNHLSALGMHLRGFGYTVEFVKGGLIVRNPNTAERGTAKVADAISCRPREEDGGGYWYFTSDLRPLAEADHYTDALIAIKGYLGSPR